jgi:hypothetical protein
MTTPTVMVLLVTPWPLGELGHVGVDGAVVPDVPEPLVAVAGTPFEAGDVAAPFGEPPDVLGPLELLELTKGDGPPPLVVPPV